MPSPGWRQKLRFQPWGEPERGPKEAGAEVRHSKPAAWPLPLPGGLSQAWRSSALWFHHLGQDQCNAGLSVQHPEVSKRPGQDNP